MDTVVCSVLLMTLLLMTCQQFDNIAAMQQSTIDNAYYYNSDSPVPVEKACLNLVPKVQIFIAVCSHPGHFLQREAIRDTWAKPEVLKSFGAVVLFFIGHLPGNSQDDINTRQKVTSEMRRYNDIVLLTHDDTYRNLTLKTIGAIKWTLTYCKDVPYFMKADDDTFVNLTRLMAGLVEDNHMTHRRFMIGCTIAAAQPIRSPVSKWYTPISEYAAAFYPTYLSGFAYVISGNLLADVYEATQTYRRPFWIEDVFITGICAAKVKATLIHNGLFTYQKHVMTSSTSNARASNWHCRLATTHVAFHEATPHIMRSVAQC